MCSFLLAFCMLSGVGFGSDFEASFVLDGTSGTLTEIRCADPAHRFGLSEISITIETSLGVFSTSGADTSFRHDSDADEYIYEGSGFELRTRWNLGAHFAERDWTLRRPDKAPFQIIHVQEALTFKDDFERIDLHTDGSVYAVPINLFLRKKDISIGVGVSYPWVELRPKGLSGIEAHYDVYVDVADGSAFTSERFFIVVCPYTGYICDKAGGETRILLLDKPEPMDWGEVWAMQDYVAHYLPEQALPGKGYWVWLNGWWARSSKAWEDPSRVVDRMAYVGVYDIMTPEVWWGYGEHPVNIPRLQELTPGESLPLPEKTQELIEYADGKGVHIGSFACPPTFIYGQEAWLATREDGTRYQFLGDLGTPGYNCLANREFIEPFIGLQKKMLAASGARFWAWDGRLLSYSEVDDQYPGDREKETFTVLPCFSSTHGHTPGHQFYGEYLNIRSMIEEIRSAFPEMCLQSYWGLKRGMPWIMQGLNAAENYYEITGVEDQALQVWYTENYRFVPTYMNWTNLHETEPDRFEYNLVQCISSSVHAQIGGSYRSIDDARNIASFRKWMDFAESIRPYLSKRRTLFGQPGSTWLHGSAHCIDDTGYLFLFRNEATDEESSSSAIVPLNHMIGLENGERFKVVQLYPEENVDLGVYRYGDEIGIRLGSAFGVYRIEATDEDAVVREMNVELQEKATPAYRKGDLLAILSSERGKESLLVE